MKLLRKILLGLLCLLAIAPVVAVVALQLPGVQKRICNAVADNISSDLNGSLSIGDVYYALFDRVIIKDALLKDEAQDTVAYLGKLSLNVKLLKAITGRVSVSKVELSDALLNLQAGPDGKLNLVKIFPEKEKVRDTTSKGILAFFDNILVDVRSIKVNDMDINFTGKEPTTYHRNKKGRLMTPGEHTIDWNDMHMRDLDIDISDIRYNLRKQSVSLKVNGISVEESRGFKLDELRFKAALDAAGIHIEDFRYADNYSDLKLPYANALFEQFSDFSDFLHKVSLDCSLEDSKVCLSSLGLFLPGLDHLTLPLTASGKVKGPVANMKLSSFTVDGPGLSHVELSGQLNGLPLSEQTIMSANISNCYFTTAGIEGIASSLSYKPFKRGTIRKFAPGTKFNFTGFMDGFFTDFVAYGGLSSNIGKVDVDLLCQAYLPEGFSMDGFLDASNFDLGKFLQNDKLGELSCNATLSGYTSSDKSKTYMSMDSIYVSKFNFNDYDYKGITASGWVDYNGISVKAVDDDPNLDFALTANILNAGDGERTYDVDLDLKQANLAALHLDKQEVSLIGMKLNGKVTQTGKDSFVGDIFINDMGCTNATGLHYLGDIQIDASLLPSDQNLTFRSSFLNGTMTGTTSVSDLVNDAKYALLNGKLDNLLRGQTSPLKYSGGDFNVNFKVSDIRQLLAFVMPDMHIENGTELSFSTDGSGSPALSLTSELLSYKDIYARNVMVFYNGDDSSSVAAIDADLVRIGSLVAVNNHLGADIKGNQVKLDLVYNNDSENEADRGNIKATVAFPDSSAAYDVLIAMDNSTVMADGKEWKIRPSSVFFNKKRIAVRDFLMEGEDQFMRVDGIISDNPEEACTVELNNFDMSLANLFLKEPLSLDGRLTGNATAKSLLGDYELTADLAADSVLLSGNLVGDLAVNATWEEQAEKIGFSIVNMLADKKVIDIAGDMNTKDKTMAATATIDSLRAVILTPFLSSIMSDLGGSISMTADVTGPLDKLEINSKDGHLNGFEGKITYTQVRYGVEGDFELSPTGVTIRQASMTDGLNGSGRISGGVSFDHFKDIRLDVRMRVRDMLALNTGAGDNSTFYGNAVASNGDISIVGPTSDINLNINATTGPSTLRIPLASITTSTQSILTFVNNEVPVLSSYDSLLLLHSANKEKDKAKGNFGVNLRLRATNDAEVNLDIDRTSGNTLKAKGTGDININVYNEQFDIKGSYGVDEGSFNYKLLGLTNKVFSINKGGSVNFTGDVMNTELDVTAEYDTKASISPLLADSISTSARKNVKCMLDVSGKLSNPQLDFDVDILDIEPAIKAQIEPAFMTEEKRMKQFVAVLLTGNFLPDDASGINNATTGVNYLNLGEIMANQINDILEELNIPVDLGLNYQNNDSGRDVVDVAISTQLFNNRVTINGNIGNRQYSTAGRSDVMGDVDIAIKLGKKGNTRLTLFSHSPDDFSSYLDQTQRNGAGIAFSKEFDDFKELFSSNPDRQPRRERGDRPRPEGRPDPGERGSRPDRTRE
ncbi:MAG: translocation/assembly module TamB domain-containing protein [Bacteroidales bacterium]|nr:translocation/assembly module TamB domain-containing protein [Bacteroidales bacterium]